TDPTGDRCLGSVGKFFSSSVGRAVGWAVTPMLMQYMDPATQRYAIAGTAAMAGAVVAGPVGAWAGGGLFGAVIGGTVGGVVMAAVDAGVASAAGYPVDWGREFAAGAAGGALGGLTNGLAGLAGRQSFESGLIKVVGTGLVGG